MERHSETFAMAAFVQVLFIMVAITENAHGQSCGGKLTGSGRFTSPNYPNDYPSNAYCQWNLTADASNGTGNAISLFIETLSLESHYDAVEIYSEGILMARYQESTEPHKAVYGRSITVIFHSDLGSEQMGFSIFFNSTGPECGTSCTSAGCFFWTPNFPNQFPKESHCEWSLSNQNGLINFESTTVISTPFIGQLTIESILNGSSTTATYLQAASLPTADIFEQFVALNFTGYAQCRVLVGTGFLLSLGRSATRCGEQLVGKGTFSTPNYPQWYPPNMICVWKLKALPGLRIQLIVTDLRLESFFDYVRVYSENQLVDSYTGSFRPFTLTLGSDVTVKFRSDDIVTDAGFAASFISV